MIKYLDKIKHIFFCLLISAVVGTFLSLIGGDFALSTIAGVYAAEVAAVTKEWFDTTTGGKWDWYDFLADQVGVVLFIAWMAMFHFSKG